LSNHATYLPYMSGSVAQCSEVKWLQRKRHPLNDGKNISFFSNFAKFPFLSLSQTHPTLSF
jgi:hypothetical protein